MKIEPQGENIMKMGNSLCKAQKIQRISEKNGKKLRRWKTELTRIIQKQSLENDI